MTSLTTLIENESKRSEIVADCVTTLEGEIESKSGVTGLAIKNGYKAVANQQDGQLIPNAVNKMLPRFVEKLDAYYQDYLQLDEGSRPVFSDYLVSRDAEVTESLLEVTDFRAANTKRAVLAKAYNALRPMAANQVKQGLPLVGDIVQRHVTA